MSFMQETQQTSSVWLVCLASVEAIFRIQPERRLRPAVSHLAGGGRLKLLTRYGPLNLLGSIGKNLTYENLLSHSPKMEELERVPLGTISPILLDRLLDRITGDSRVSSSIPVNAQHPSPVWAPPSPAA